jgi:hypothetical protein
VGPKCQSLGPTVPRPRRLLSDSGRCRLACAHGLVAAVSPPTVSPPPHHRRPPPLAAIKGAHPHRGAPFLPPPLFTPPPLHRRSHRRRAAVDSPLRPLSDRFNHAPSTVPSCTTSSHPELSTTTHGRRPHRRSPLADHTSPSSSFFR